MLAPEVEGRPWEEQVLLDDASYRAQLAYLFERSAFYRDKLAAAGIGSGGGCRRPRGGHATPADREGRAARQPNR